LKKTLVQIIILAVVFLAVFFVNRQYRRGEYFTLAGLIQGTTYRITYASRDGINLQYQIDSLLADFDKSLSSYDPESVISSFNRNDPDTEADDKFIEVFNKALDVNEKTGGAFDITVGPVVNALGFGPEEAMQVDSVLINNLMNCVGMDKVRLEGRKLVKDTNCVVIDVNAIAQGYSVDVVADYLEKRKINNYLVEIGGEVKTKGRNALNRVWRIGIDRPVEGNMIPGDDLQAVISLKNKALATSGNYRKFYESEGIKYVHTINPKTGYPVVSNLLSATVVASDCMTADAYATSFMVMGLEESIRFLENNDFLDALLIYSDDAGNYQLYVSEKLTKIIEQ